MIYRMDVKTAMDGLQYWANVIGDTNDKQGFFLNERAAKNLEQFLVQVDNMLRFPSVENVSELLSDLEARRKTK